MFMSPAGLPKPLNTQTRRIIPGVALTADDAGTARYAWATARHQGDRLGHQAQRKLQKRHAGVS